MVDKLGPTGEFPQGRLNKDDAGELAIAISIEHGKIIVQFGGKVSWIGMDAPHARALAAILIGRADELEGKM